MNSPRSVSMRCRWITCLFWLVASVLGAENGSAQPPENAGCVAAPSPGTAWDIAISYTEPPPAGRIQALRRPLSIHGECYQNYIRLLIRWTDGNGSEGYVCGNRVYLKGGEHQKASILPVQDADYLYPVFTKGYTGTAWIVPGLNVGEEARDKYPCQKYVRPPGPGPSAINGDCPLPELIAWIRVEDKAPACVKLGSALYIYSPLHPIGVPTALPAEIQQLIEASSRQQKTLEAMRQKQQP
ncbi:MAG: hypothetical protein ACFUZC_12305 [Chthoniobacteraceae bacterium]